MINKKYKGQYIGDSAVRFFDELAKLESSGNYKLDTNRLYKGRYQLGVDILKDMGWVSQNSTWNNVKFQGDALKKWKLKDKDSFLNNPAAQDEAMMNSILYRWYTLKKYKDRVGKRLHIPKDAKYKLFCKKREPEKIEAILRKKRAQGYNVSEMRGKDIKLSSSGMLAAGHLCGQGALGDAIANGFKGQYGIPVDGNDVPFYFYHEVLKNYDLSVIIGFKDPGVTSGLVYKKDTKEDKKNIEDNMNSGRNRRELGDGVYEFNGQKFQEIWELEEYVKESQEERKEPEKVFVKTDAVILNRLKSKFDSEDLYNKDYIKYFEEKTGKKVYEQNKEEIEMILKNYEERTKNEENIGNFIGQVGFDMFRGREDNGMQVKIQDLLLYIIENPIKSVSKIQSLELVLEEFSCKSVKYPNKKARNGEVLENQLPETYNKYMNGVKDIDEINISAEKNEKTIMKIIEILSEREIYEDIFKRDEKGIYSYPLAKRLIDNIIMEFIEISVGFKEKEEVKYFDNVNYTDSNIIRNYILLYIEENKGIKLVEEGENELYPKLLKLGQSIRVTTLLKQWIESKSLEKIKNIKSICKVMETEYKDYGDGKFRSEDEKLIFDLFERKKEIRDYAADINAMNLYSFYKEFYKYENMIKIENKYYVNDNCILKCMAGSGTSRLIIDEDAVRLRGGKQANIGDTKIKAFKACKFARICRPKLIGTWEKETDVEVRGQGALLSTATIKCVIGGTISIDDPGQKEIGVASDKQRAKSQSKRDVDCVYKILKDICYEINNKIMQSPLKKQSQQFKREKKAYASLKKEVTREIEGSELDRIKGKGSNIGVFKKYDGMANDPRRKRLEQLRARITKEKEKELREAIYLKFILTLRLVKVYGKTENDKKGIIKKYGNVVCEHSSRSFYNVKTVALIAYGYLMRAGAFSISEDDKNRLEKEVNKEYEISEVKPDVVGIWDPYAVLAKVKRDSEETKLKMMPREEIEKAVAIGVSLYEDYVKAPDEKDMVDAIVREMKGVVRCPYSLKEWGIKHKLVREEDEKTEQKETKVSNCPNSKGWGTKAPWLQVAYAEMKKYRGQTERSKSFGDRIRNVYFPRGKNGKQNPISVPWCAAFISYCISESGYTNSSNPSVAAHDWGIAPRKDNRLRGWFEGEKTEPFVGAIGIFIYKPSKDGKSWNSHVAILVGKTKNNRYAFLGGNQSNAITISDFPKSDVLYFMKPKGYAVSKEEKMLPLIADVKKATSTL